MNHHRQTQEGAIRQVATVNSPTRWGLFRMVAFERDLEQSAVGCPQTAQALVLGEIGAGPALVRIHSRCITGEALGSLRCDCAAQLHQAFIRAALRLPANRRRLGNWMFPAC